MGRTEGDSKTEHKWLFSPNSMLEHFCILRPLGRGGMAEVYLARDTKLGRKVALKVILPRTLGSQGAIDQFLFEARATAKFNHPNIITIYAVGEDQGKPYVALEYLRGQSLRQRMNEERPSIQATLRIGLAVTEALQVAHDSGILHRDLKPANILLAADGRLRVLDFGLAKVIERPVAPLAETQPIYCSDHPLAAEQELHKTLGEGIRGTPEYMAPEQWKHQEMAGSTDIWALGVVLHELVTGRLPYQESNVVHQAAKVCSSDEVPSLGHEQGVPARLSALIERCLKKDPLQRPSAAEVVERLRELTTEGLPPLSADESPFRGLLPFLEEHRFLFFGRDSETTALVERLRAEPVLPLVGPSGAGKSSLIQAGVIPRLRERGPLEVIQLRPGSQPLLTLASRIIAVQQGAPERETSSPFGISGPGSGPDGLREGTDEGQQADGAVSEDEAALLAQEIQATPSVLNLMLNRLASERRCSILLFVDQLEELVTLVDSKEVRLRFMEAICAAADDSQLPVRVVFTLRDDFLVRLAEGTGVREVMSHIAVLRSPETGAMEEILTRAVELAGYDYDDPHLVRQMVAEVEGEVSCLPLLQFTAQMLWNRRNRAEQLLCRASYEAMGGVAGALAHHADGVMAGLSPDELQIARAIILKLVTTESTRRVLPRSKVLEGMDQGALRVLERLTTSRLISAKKTAADGEPALELVHESLLMTWKRLRRWIDESREDLVFLEEIRQATALWEKRGRLEAEVWQGDALVEAQLKASRLDTIPQDVRPFLETGSRRERRKQRLKWIAIAGAMAALVLVVLVLALQNREARQQSTRADQQRAFAEQGREQAELKSAEALREGARVALSRRDLREAQAKLRASLELHDSVEARSLWWQFGDQPLQAKTTLPAYGWSMDLSSDGRTLAFASMTGAIYLLDVRTTQIIRVLHGNREIAWDVKFAPDQRHLAIGAADGQVRLWDLESGKVKILNGHSAGVYSVGYSPDGRWLASAGLDATIRLWDTATGSQARTMLGHTGAIRRLCFSPNGRLLASAGLDETIRLWDLATGAQIKKLRGHKRATKGLSFSPDGKLLASGGGDRTVRLWDVATGAMIKEIEGPGMVASVRFHPDGKMLAWGENKNVRLWRISSNTEIKVLRHGSFIYDVGFGPKGKLLVSSEFLGKVHIWDVAKLQRPERPPGGHGAPVWSVDISPDGALIASASMDHTIRIWDAASGAVRRVLRGHHSEVWGLSFSPDGRTLASGGTKTARLWDVASGKQLNVLGGHSSTVIYLAFSPDGRLLATPSMDSTIRLWEVSTGRLLRVLRGHTAGVVQARFSPDGKLLATGSHDATIRIWEVSTGRQRKVLRGHGDAVYGPSFSPDGGSLVSGSQDATVRLWDLKQGTSRVIHRCHGHALSPEFHPDGKQVGVICTDGTTRVLDLRTGTSRELRGHRGPVRFLRFSRNGDQVATAGTDRSVRLWSTQTGHPVWRAPVLLSEPVEIYTHVGWRQIGGAAPSSARKALQWRRALEGDVRVASQGTAGRHLCTVTHEGVLALWDLVADRRRFQRPLVAVERLLAVSGGCLTLTRNGEVRLYDSAGKYRSLDSKATAVATSGEEILLATRSGVALYDGAGRRTALYPAEGAATALARVGRWLVLGFHDGAMQRFPIAPHKGERTQEQDVHLQGVSSSEVTRLLPGPEGTLIAGFANGLLGIWELKNGSRLHHVRLNGPVAHLLRKSKQVYAASQLGGHLVWDLSLFDLDYCKLLGRVWKQAPVVWKDGRTVLRAPPAAHRCIVSRAHE
jgi:WD40 repeat protein/serine/threonine protein kinase